MNGAAMNCRQEPVHRSQHKDSSGLHNPGYCLQINHQANKQPQHSKTMNYPSFSNMYQVDGYSDNFQYIDSNSDSRPAVSREVKKDPRSKMRSKNEPIDLPVPQFEVDEHSVSNWRNANSTLIQSTKDLDLDTRIDLLIKSKALAGMHPIFSDLNESEESSTDSDDLFISKPKSKSNKNKSVIPSPPREIETHIRESFDDPEKPLSRPPSPFLSRATYLFWFNKAIEIKQQAKAQEQALLEQAAKRLIQDNTFPNKLNHTDNPGQKRKPLLTNLLDEISKEVKDIIKREFIREVIEDTAFSTLDDWWDQEAKKDVQKTHSKPSDKIKNKNKQDKVDDHVVVESQGSTSPKVPFPWGMEGLKQPADLQTVTHGNFSTLCNVKTPPDHTYQDNYKEKSYETQRDLKLHSEESSGESRLNIFQDDCKSVESNTESEDCETAGNRHLTGVNVSASREAGLLIEENQESRLAPSSMLRGDDTIEEKTDDDSLEIVKDILDFIYNNVNKVILERNADEKYNNEVNEDLLYENKFISTGHTVKEERRLKTPQDFA